MTMSLLELLIAAKNEKYVFCLKGVVERGTDPKFKLFGYHFGKLDKLCLGPNYKKGVS